MRIYSAALLITLTLIARGQALEEPVSVLFGSDHPLPAAVLVSLQHEAESAVFPAMIRLSWARQDAASAPGVYHRLTIVRFRGDCSLAAPLPLTSASPANAEALGQTRVVNGDVLPISDIRCDAARKYLGREIRALPPSEQDEAFGRALGRVVAHELYHMLLRTRTHGKTGLARPAVSRAELLAPRHAFAAAEQQRLAEGVSEESESDATGR